jgi:hypothetical protein
LAEAIPSDRRAAAIEECVVEVLHIPAGNGAVQATMPLRGGLGLLMLDGLVIRRSGVDKRFGAELLGEGDLLRPNSEEDESPMLHLETGWSVIHPTRLAVLDARFVQRLTSYPELAPAIVSRVMRRARNLAVNMAIVHQARVDVRLHMLLWHLAGRWGRVRSEGTVVRLRLTHALLADLVAARRPTVTSALSELSRRGLVRSSGDEWVLLGEAPGELLNLERTASAPAARSARVASSR